MSALGDSSTARALLIVAAIAAAAISARAQTTTEQQVKTYVEGLRGRVSEATYENGRYSHAGITFDVPNGWNYGGTIPGELAADDTAHWTDPATGVAFYAWLSTRTASADDVPGLLAGVVTDKTRQRQRQGFRQWTVRPDSVQPITVGGHQGLRAVADFQSRSGASRVEYLTWIFTPRSRVLFFSNMSPDQLANDRIQFDRIVESASLP
jgi:hypothetical protein